MRVVKLIDEVVMVLSFVCTASILGQLFNCYYYLAIFSEALKSYQSLKGSMDVLVLNIETSPLLIEARNCLCVVIGCCIMLVLLFIVHLIVLKPKLWYAETSYKKEGVK